MNLRMRCLMSGAVCKRSYLRYGNVRLRKQRWKRNCAPTPRHTPSHACQRRKIDELAYALPDGRRGRKRSYLRSGNVRFEETKMETQLCSTPRHTPSYTHVNDARPMNLRMRCLDERRGRKRPCLRSGNVRLGKQGWNRNCASPRGIRHRTHVSDARSMNLRMRCLMGGAVASGRIYALGMYVLRKQRWKRNM